MTWPRNPKITNKYEIIYIFEPTEVETLGVFHASACYLLADLGGGPSILAMLERPSVYFIQRISVLVQRFNAVLLRDSLPAADSTDWRSYPPLYCLVNFRLKLLLTYFLIIIYGHLGCLELFGVWFPWLKWWRIPTKDSPYFLSLRLGSATFLRQGFDMPTAEMYGSDGKVITRETSDIMYILLSNSYNKNRANVTHHVNPVNLFVQRCSWGNTVDIFARDNALQLVRITGLLTLCATNALHVPTTGSHALFHTVL